MTISAEQCRAARALLDWSREEAALAAGVARETFARFERGTQVPYSKNLIAIRKAFEDAGIVFIDPNGGGQGVRFKAP